MQSLSLKFGQTTNLEYFMKAQKLNRRQACWALYLSRFDFTLKYIPGTKIEKVDGLSRRLDWKVSIEKDNENQTSIKEQWICRLAEIVIEESKIEILENYCEKMSCRERETWY